MTVIANPIDANLLKAVKWAHLCHAFIIFFHPSWVQTGAVITHLLHIFLFSFCPEPEMHFIKRTLRQFKCKTKLMKAF